MATELMRRSTTRRAAFERMSLQDLANLIVETPDTPMHMAVLAILDGERLRGLGSEDVLLRVREHVEGRLDALPELRQVPHHASMPGGRPVWVDDPSFDIEQHVLAASVPSPGREAQLLAATEALLGRLLDRSRPLWEMWLLTGLAESRLAVLLKVHHSVTDGLGMLRIAQSLFDTSPDAAAARAPRWNPSPAPSWGRLSADAAAAAARLLWTAATGPPHPIWLAESVTGLVTTVASVTGRTLTGRRARLNRPIGPHRKMAVVHLELASVKRVAHAHGVKVNDVVLELAAAGIRRALVSRGESLAGVSARALMAVDPPTDRTPGARNRAGAVIVSLPLEPSSCERLRLISGDSRRARRWQRAGVVERSGVIAVRMGLGRFLSRHQTLVDLAVSNLKGPTEPLYLVGCRMVDAIPITPINGNVTINFCALSYAGHFDICVLADAASWPDLPVLVRAVRAGWKDLNSEPHDRPQRDEHRFS
ncbi:MAG: wax ester/triacylglycerol synthase domain-containing protein [Candidatus Limnocylindria bacterium]